MILRPENLQEMVSQLWRLPEERRKVIVLAGRHLNEGSLRIAGEHHQKWEEYGVIVVKIPALWTPHGFWNEALKRGLGVPGVEAMAREVPSDYLISEALSVFGVPVVNLHGTPRFACDTHEGSFGNTRPEVSVRSDSRVVLPKRHYFVRSKRPFDSRLAANELLVEVRFAGKPIKPNLGSRAYAKGLSDSAVPDHLSFSYLSVWRFAAHHLQNFNRRHARNLTGLLAHLAATGLKPI